MNEYLRKTFIYIHDNFIKIIIDSIMYLINPIPNIQHLGGVWLKAISTSEWPF